MADRVGEALALLFSKMALPVKKVPEAEQWRTGLMDNLMTMKNEKYLAVSDSKRICAMIDSLCNI